MTDEEMDETLADLESAVQSVTSNLRFTPSGIKAALGAVSTISRLSFALTHEVIERVRALEVTTKEDSP